MLKSSSTLGQTHRPTCLTEMSTLMLIAVAAAVSAVIWAAIFVVI